MSHLPFTIVAYLFNSFSILADKFLLTKKIPDPFTYIFYISLLSLLSLIFLPFGKAPSWYAFNLASLSTIFWTMGAYFMYKALKEYQASRVAPVIGTVIPIVLLLYYYFLNRSISLNEVWATIVLTLGLFTLTISYWKSQAKSLSNHEITKELILELTSAILFSLSYIILKEAYNSANFITVLAYSKIILIPLILICLIIPHSRKIALNSEHERINFLSKTGLLMLGGQISGVLSELLITFSISLANPALVNSLQGIQYASLFILSLFLSRRYPTVFEENLSPRIIFQKLIGICLIALGLFMLAFAHSTPAHPRLGYTFSPRYAQSLGLDPKVTFVEAINDLSPETIRIPVYWDEIQPKNNQDFDFKDLDYYVKMAQYSNIKLSLAIGFKVPRFPECYSPNWAKNIPPEEFENALFKEISAVVNRYKDYPNLEVWQVENEPLFPFGFCPQIDFDRVKREVNLVRSLDHNHPIMITESGEFGVWLISSNIGDIVGTTMYRRTLSPYFPYFKSPLPPFYYQLKGIIVHLFHPKVKTYSVELQGEPWSNSPLPQTSLNYQLKAFPVADIKNNVDFSNEAQFDTLYYWGVEWWYYLKNQGHPEYLNQAILIYKDIN